MTAQLRDTSVMNHDTVFYYKCFVACTRLAILDGGFFMTMYSMTEVARANEYLSRSGLCTKQAEETHHVNMYWAWLFLRFTSAARP